ncbi:MAG: DUF4920 domain-containing protein [Flavobacteriaceae bacterium]
MKKYILVIAVLGLSLTACKTSTSDKKEVKKEKIALDYDAFGAEITAEKAMTSAEMLTKFKSLQLEDSVEVKFASKINEVCSKKGCWMKLNLGDSTETMVRFKDYGFFMPLDSKDREVIVEGIAKVKKTSVADLKHYAEDAGKSKEEIAKITEPKLEYTFEASGVLMKK